MSAWANYSRRSSTPPMRATTKTVWNESYHARIQAIARARSVTSWASLAANVAAKDARMHFLMTSYWYPKAYRAYVESDARGGQPSQPADVQSSRVHAAPTATDPSRVLPTANTVFWWNPALSSMPRSPSRRETTSARSTQASRSYEHWSTHSRKIAQCTAATGCSTPPTTKCWNTCPLRSLSSGPAYKLLPLLPPQSPAQQEHLAQYLKWRRENYPDGRPPIWIEEDHPCPQIRAWRAANPEVQLTIRVATTQAPVPLPEWYRALV